MTKQFVYIEKEAVQKMLEAHLDELLPKNFMDAVHIKGVQMIIDRHDSVAAEVEFTLGYESTQDLKEPPDPPGLIRARRFLRKE